MTGGGDDLAAFQLVATALAVGIAGIAVFRTGGILGVFDLGAAGVVVLIQLAVGLLAHLAHGLVLAGGCAALVTGGGDDLAAFQLVAAVLAVGIAGIAVFRTGGVLGVLDLGAAGMLTVGGLPAQHGIAAVDIAQIPLEAVTQRGGHGLGLQLVGGLGGSGAVTADALLRSAFQIVDIGERVCGAYHSANSVAAGFGHSDLAGAVAVGDAGFLHHAHQTAHQILRGGDSAGVIHILDDGLLGIAHDAAHIRAAGRDSAGVVAAGHGARVKLIAEAAQILHAGHIALIAAFGHSAVDQHTGQTAYAAGIADLGVHSHGNAGDHAGDIRILAVAHHAGHIARIDGELTCGVHAALNRQVLDGGVVILCAIHIAEQPQIQRLAGFGRLVVDGQVLDGIARAVEAAGKFLRAAADRRPVEAIQVDLRRQHAGDGGAAAVDLLGEPDQLVRRADLIHAVLLSGCYGSLHGDGARGLCFAAGGGDGGCTGLDSSDSAVLDGGDRFIGGSPDDGLVGGVFRGHDGGQPGGVALVQLQRRLIQRHAGGQNGRKDGDNALRLCAAAGGGDGGGALALGSDNAVLHGGDRVIGGCPHQRVGGVLRGHGGGQSRLFGGAQAQRRLIQRHAGGGNGFAGQLDIQLIAGARHSVHNGQIGNLAGAVCRGERNILADQKLVQLRGGQRKGIAALIIEVAAFAVRYHQESSVLDFDGGIAAIGDGSVIFARLTIDRLDGIGRSAHLYAERACWGCRYRDGAFRLCAAAGGGDDGRTDLHGGDGAVLDGGNILVGGRPCELVGGIRRSDRGGQGGGLTFGQAQLRLIQRHAGGGNVRACLFKPHRHIVIGEVGGLGEAVAVIAGAGDVEHEGVYFPQTGQIPLSPVHDDVIRAVAQIDRDLAGFCACGVVADGYQLYPVIRADLGGQIVAVDQTIQQIGGVIDIHMVNNMLGAVSESQSGQDVRLVVFRPVYIAIVYGKVVGAVVAAAGAGQAGNALFVDGELCFKSTVVLDVTRAVVGNGVAAAPIAVGAIVVGEYVGEACVVGVCPLVSLLLRGEPAAAAIQQRTHILGIVDQGRPVAAAGKIGAALIVGVLKGQHPQFIVVRREGADRQQRYRHHQRQQEGNDAFLHVVMFLSLV